MGFWNLFQKRNGPYRVEQSVTLFNELLARKGFQMDAPDLALAWTCFKEYRALPFTCDDDALLWEVGPFGALPGQAGKVYQWHMVRQFIRGSGEDDDIRQLTFNVDFKPGKGEDLPQAGLWTYDFGDDLQAFFAGVETHPAFTDHGGLRPVRAEVYLEQV